MPSDERFPGDLVALTADARSYTVTSLVPALAEAELAALPAWGAENSAARVERRQPAARRICALPGAAGERHRAHARAGDGADHRRTPRPTRRPSPSSNTCAPSPTISTCRLLPETVTDVADYFLFDLQRGYCDYYATAFVVLARAAGLPARFVTGFTAGGLGCHGDTALDLSPRRTRTPGRRSTSPGVGWVPFEPTAARAELARIGAARGAETCAALAAGWCRPLPQNPLPFDDRWLWLLAAGRAAGDGRGGLAAAPRRAPRGSLADAAALGATPGARAGSWRDGAWSMARRWPRPCRRDARTHWRSGASSGARWCS
jgi:hypothetical protein